MRRIVSILLIVFMFIAINLAIVPKVQAVNSVENKTTSSVANIVPAKGLEEDDMPTNTSTTAAMPKAGLEHMNIIAIVALSLVGVGSFIRAKTIKIK